jgi:hypothetical protein
MTAHARISTAKAVRKLDIVSFMTDPKLCGPHFEGDSWDHWRATLKAMFALPMTIGETEFVGSISGGRAMPRQRIQEAWIAASRRAGKDSVASLVCAFVAATFDRQDCLRPGEVPLACCLACDRSQAKIILSFVRQLFANVDLLKDMVLSETQNGFKLVNGVEIAISTNDFKSLRGRPILFACLDECAFYKSDVSANPDLEVYRAILPGMASLPNSMLVAISSPYRRGGLLFDKFKALYGQDNETAFFVKAATRQLNETIPQSVVDAAVADDPAAARSEWLGEFRDDLSSFVDSAIIENAIDVGVVARPWRPGVVYRSGTDSSGGSHDSFCGSVAHLENGIAVLDATIEIKSPANPAEATRLVSELYKAYKITSTVGDKYAAGWVIAEFAKNGIRYRHADLTCSDTFLSVLPAFNASRIRLLDSRRLATQFSNLTRRTTAMGRDVVEHNVGGFDDLAASAALALSAVAKGSGALLCAPIVMSGPPRSIPGSDVYTAGAERAWDRLIKSGAG